MESQNVEYLGKFLIVSEEVEKEVEDDYYPECELGFVYEGEFFSLSDFMRVEGHSYLHGVYCTSAFSCWGVKLEESGEEVKLFYMHW